VHLDVGSITHLGSALSSNCCGQQLTQKLEITLEACCGQQLTQKLEIRLEACYGKQLTQNLRITLEVSELESITLKERKLEVVLILEEQI
jgi:hypothetical protein